MTAFPVAEKFEEHGTAWAQFNVETVSPPDRDDARAGPMEAAAIRDRLVRMTSKFYEGTGDDAPYFHGRGGANIPPKLEAASHLEVVGDAATAAVARAGPRALREIGADGFVSAVVGAFAAHRPLILRPDD